jgi:hypothetical protein
MEGGDITRCRARIRPLRGRGPHRPPPRALPPAMKSQGSALKHRRTRAVVNSEHVLASPSYSRATAPAEDRVDRGDARRGGRVGVECVVDLVVGKLPLRI